MRHSFFKLIPAVFLSVLVLCACSAKPLQPVQTPAPTPRTDIYASTPTPAPTPAPMPESDQRALIERSRNVWEPDLEYETWFSAITDLDHNGRLELLLASLQGSGLYTWVNVWEVNENYSGLTLCPDNTGEGEAWPDIIKETLTAYRDPASGRYTYYCEDYMRDGAAHYWTGLDSFSLENGRIDVKTLASKDERYNEQGASVIHYYDADGAEIDEEAFNNTERVAFAAQTQGTQTLTLNWTQLEKQAQTVPQPTNTVRPQVSGPVTITKNPTGESLAVGGKTWFIAHADNATSLTWLLSSPQGQSYTVEQAMAANPGLQIQVLPEDTLGVSNVPVSVDGWSVQARFDGPGGSAVTAPAVIHVDDWISVYWPVLKTYYDYSIKAYGDSPSGDITSSGDYLLSYETVGVSYLARYGGSFGYCLKDLDGNGIPELLVGSPDSEYYAGKVIYDLFTLRDGAPVRLATSGERTVYKLLSDGSIFYSGSGGAAYSVFLVYQVVDDTMILKVGYVYDDGKAYQFFESKSDYFGNHDADIEINESDLFSIREQLDNSSVNFEMIPIA